MRPNLLLHKEFLRHIINNKNLDNQSDEFEVSNKSLNYRKCKNIITQAKTIYTNYSKEDFIQLKLKANKVSENNLEAIWINKLMSSNKGIVLNSEKYFDEKKSSTIRFLGNVDCANETKEKNIITRGTNYNFEEDFFKNPLRSVFDKKMNSEDNSNTFHHTKNIILIDPYIFSNNFKKGNSLVNFLDTCFNFKNNNIEKHLTLITDCPTDIKNIDYVENKIVLKYLEFLSNELNISKENLTLLRHVGKKFEGNRHLITDYALIELQHVFQEDNSPITGLFLYNDNIDANFNQVNYLIKRIIDLHNDSDIKYEDAADPKVKHSNLKFGNILNNPLFH